MAGVDENRMGFWYGSVGATVEHALRARRANAGLWGARGHGLGQGPATNPPHPLNAALAQAFRTRRSNFRAKNHCCFKRLAAGVRIEGEGGRFLYRLAGF